MLYEALQYGLKVKVNVKGWGSPEHKPSMNWFWRILDLYPFRRLTYKDSDSTERWYVPTLFLFMVAEPLIYDHRPPHRGRGRRIQKGQLIHESVVKHMQAHRDYTPGALDPENALEWSWDASCLRDPDIWT